ncbi:hypothetical protein [Desulfonatronum parangueonense]
MQAQKITTFTDKTGRLINLPTFKPMQQVELIVLFPLQEDSQPVKKRRPPEKLKGVMLEKGDIFSSTPCEDWGIS